jgi:hypothetical protein
MGLGDKKCAGQAASRITFPIAPDSHWDFPADQPFRPFVAKLLHRKGRELVKIVA